MKTVISTPKASNNCCNDINFCYTVLTSSKEGHTKSPVLR